MEPLTYFTITFDQLMMVMLTVIIAASVVGQAIFAGKQTQLARDQVRLFTESEKRLREREQPRIRITHASYGFNERQDDNVNPRSKNFVGLIFANASLLDITITHIDYEVGVPVDRPKVPTQSLHLLPVYEYRDTKLSDSLPHRLRHGETMRGFYDEDVLLARLERHDGGKPPAVLPVCRDSLGNKHTADTWTVWGKNYLGALDGPGPGYVTWDEWWAKRGQAKHHHA